MKKPFFAVMPNPGSMRGGSCVEMLYRTDRSVGITTRTRPLPGELRRTSRARVPCDSHVKGRCRAPESQTHECAQLLPDVREDVDRGRLCEFDPPGTPIETLDVV